MHSSMSSRHTGIALGSAFPLPFLTISSTCSVGSYTFHINPRKMQERWILEQVLCGARACQNAFRLSSRSMMTSFHRICHQDYHLSGWGMNSGLTWRMIRPQSTGHSTSSVRSSWRKHTSKYSICLSMGSSALQTRRMAHRCNLHQTKMAAFGFASTTVG